MTRNTTGGSTTDAPTLTHCPSCGTELSAEPTVHRHNCEQCGRDLELPRDAIKHQLCVFCKVPETDSDDSVEYHDLDTGERICANCLADLRAFKFDVGYQVFTAEFLDDEHQQAVTAALYDLSEEFDGTLADQGNTNAAHSRLEPTDEDAIERTLEAEATGP